MKLRPPMNKLMESSVLSHIHIKNFALVEQLSLEFYSGLSALTGETGAGKSILLSALGLVLGDRADADKVRANCSHTEITASFDLNDLPFSIEWLNRNGLREDHSQECIIRRSVSKEGRSRAFINGTPVPLSQLRALGEQLICIHSQHEHQTLLRISTHRELLDAFGNHAKELNSVQTAYNAWQALAELLNTRRSASAETNARIDLLNYQTNELEALALEEGEITKLEQEQQQLSHAETLHQALHQVCNLCNGDGNTLLQGLHQASQLLDTLPHKNTITDDAKGMLDNALINVQEAHSEIEKYQSSIIIDETRLQQIHERLSEIYSLARKHNEKPEALCDLLTRLNHELQQLTGSGESVEELEQDVKIAEALFDKHAQALSKKRKKAAKTLTTQINQQLHHLAMERASIDIQMSTARPSQYGAEKVEFLISTIPGQPAKPLAKVASGGELSRISLAIQVVTAQNQTVPTIVFDEVDVGIGGTTGDVVGKLLRELGSYTQVLCVTHLAQVASKGHRHIQVQKKFNENTADSELSYMEGQERIQEIARMMGGTVNSEQSQAHAKQMLEQIE